MKNNLRVIKNVLLAMLSVLVAILLKELATMLIPLALALFFAILLQPILLWFERKKWPFGLSLTVIYLTSISTVGLIGLLAYQTGLSLFEQKDKILGQVNIKLNHILDWMEDLSGLEVTAFNINQAFTDLLSADWILKSSGTVAGFLGDFTGLFIMTSLYLAALLGGILRYEQYIGYLESDNEEKEEKLLKGFEQVKSSIVTYIKVKFLMSLATGIGFGLVCWFFGLDFALFWGFFAFILNFIPTVGSIVATIPPVLLGLIQFDSTGTLLLLFVILGAIQFFFGNVIEPRLLGSSLSLNTVVVILGLVFWGYLWGVTGMLLSVPLLVLMKVVMSQVPDASLIVRLMGSSKFTDEQGE